MEHSAATEAAGGSPDRQGKREPANVTARSTILPSAATHVQPPPAASGEEARPAAVSLLDQSIPTTRCIISPKSPSLLHTTLVLIQSTTVSATVNAASAARAAPATSAAATEPVQQPFELADAVVAAAASAAGEL